MKNLFDTFKNSIFSPQFYAAIPNTPLKNALTYFLIFSAVMAVIQVIFLIPSFFNFQKDVPKLINTAVNYYPKELEITIKNGQVSTTAKEPYFVPVPSQLKGSEDELDMEAKKNIIVIDTKTPYSVKKFNEYETAAWLTKDSLFYMEDSQIKGYDLSTMKDYKINQNQIRSITNSLNPYIKFIAPLLAAFALLGIYFVYLLRLVFALMYAVMIFLVAKILNRNISYSSAYKTTLYAMTLGLLLEVFIFITQPYLKLHTFPFMLSLITIGVVIFNYMQTDKVEPHKELLASTSEKKPKKPTVKKK